MVYDIDQCIHIHIVSGVKLNQTSLGGTTLVDLPITSDVADVT